MSRPVAALLVGAVLLAAQTLTAEAFAQKAQFERNKPHVNVGTIGHDTAKPKTVAAPADAGAPVKLWIPMELLVPIGETER